MSATYTTSHATPAPLTLERLRRLIDKIGPEPIGEWMRSQGFAPENSLLFLPERMRPEFPGELPKYVRFSWYAPGPILCRDVLGIMNGGASHG